MATIKRRYTLGFFLQWAWKWLKFIFGWPEERLVRVQSISLKEIQKEFNVTFLGNAELVAGDQITCKVKKRWLYGIVMETNASRTRINFKPDFSEYSFWVDRVDCKKLLILSRKEKKNAGCKL